ncbi:MAG: ABC transporter permease [Bacteroidota bacterium]
MLSNYVKFAFRNFSKNKLYTAINTVGLTIGISCFLLIVLYVQYQLSYDSHYEQADQIYRVAQIQKGNTFRGTDRFNSTPLPLASALKEEFPEVQTAVTLQTESAILSRQNKVFTERGVYAEAAVFDVFSIHTVSGSGKEALLEENGILLTQSLAEKYFGASDPIGETLLFQNEQLLTVKGVVENPPKNQHFTYDYITSLENLRYYRDSDLSKWGNNNYKSYVVLPEGYDYHQLEDKMRLAFTSRIQSAYEGVPFQAEFFLQPIQDIHLFSNINFELAANGDIRYIYLFGSIAFIILLLAAINYINLSTAASVQRSQEIGVRKVLGAAKQQIIYLFLGESFILIVICFLLSIGLTSLLLPFINQLLEQDIPFTFLGDAWIWLGTLGIVFLIGGLSGLYPAIISSLVSPTKAMKGDAVKKRSKTSMQDLLVIAQFVAAVVLSISSLVIYQQLQYVQQKNLGYERDQVIYVPYESDEIGDQFSTIENELLAHPQIEKVTFANYLPLNLYSQTLINDWEGNTTEQDAPIYRNTVGYDFFDVFEMEIIEGRAFSPSFATDSLNSYILNEAAVQALGWESAIGKQFNGGQVVGVVRDFHFQTFDLAIEPLYLTYGRAKDSPFGNITMKVKMDDLENTLAHIQSTIKNIAPQSPFEYQFMDETYQALYRFEQRLGQLLTISTLLALLIACVGLFGLIAYNVTQRTKEIGIRKVLGASVTGIVALLSKDFIQLVGIAFVIATPIAWYFMNEWLQDFAYRIELQWWVFAFAGLAAIGIALLTVSFQSMRAALANPVESLRSE